MTPTPIADRCTIEVHLTEADLAEALRRDARDGLTARPKHLPPKWFYDERGSLLFEDITRLEEYYPTRRETEILEREASAIAARTGATTLLELGAGTSTKTRLLLDALADAGTLDRIVPFDVCEPVLVAAGPELAAAYPDVRVDAVVGDFEQHLGRLPMEGTTLVAFLGGTIGNLTPSERHTFLTDVREGLAPGDTFLLGTDLVKGESRLVAAYDDAAGVTAAFNKNVLTVLNRTLAADFQPDRFEHVAVWNAEEEWIEMRLRSLRPQSVHIGDLGMRVHFAKGEEIRTEISAKFRRDRVASELAAAGYLLTHWWTDPDEDFALSLAVPA